ncbi:MAG: pantoate--beta-alanine ligase [Nitriliruptoraceae bacterium]|nr:pantoate--beta-alanine ligase [Nitriliruptoraceae bacterium]
MEQLTTIDAVRAHVAAQRRAGARVALVPTMGALHEGHLALVEAAQRHAEVVIVSIFVNPTQFDRADDLEAYPRDLPGDLAALRALPTPPSGVFTPAVGELYPTAPRTRVSVAGLTDGLCGASRPGHFDGVATVVTKLLTIVAPDVAVFGRKDRQQLEVIRTLVADLDLPVTVLGVPTVRDPDGLARSSRNRRLSPAARQVALALPRSLAAAARAGVASRGGGGLDPTAIAAAAQQVLATAGVQPEYLEAVDPVTLAPPPDGTAVRLLVAVAAVIDGVRLIDNVEVGDPDDEAALLALA